ncbi:unnamed protein product [Urochloa humidicola]
MASSSESLSSDDDTMDSSSESLSSDDNDEESWRTIDQIKRLKRREYDEDTMFLCRASVIDIDCTDRWCYLGCDTCQKSMYGASSKYRCRRCGPIKRPIYWYKLNAKVQDATGTMNLMIFCEVAEELVGVSAEDLIGKIKNENEWFTLPSEIKALIGSTHTFQVFDKHRDGSFSVNSIMDHVSVPALVTTPWIRPPSSEPSSSDDDEDRWRTIDQIKRLKRREYDEDTMFLCRASLIDIDCTDRWCYLGCDTCQKSMHGASSKYRCIRCGPIKRPIYWYKLNAKVQDATGTMNLMIFCEVAEELVGVSAEELVYKIKNDNEWSTLPNEIKALLGSTHTFQIFDKHRNGSFSVNSIMDYVTVPVSDASTTQCKGQHAPKGSVNAAVLTPSTTPCKEKPAPEGSATTTKARSKSTRPQKPNKRLRGDDWIN